MSYQLKQADRRTITTQHAAIESIRRLLVDAKFAELAADYHSLDGDAFLAFLLLPGVSQLELGVITAVFDAAYCGDAQSEQEAIEKLLASLGWQRNLDDLGEDVDASDVATREWLRFREVFELRYVFVKSPSGYHVFDAQIVDRQLRN